MDAELEVVDAETWGYSMMDGIKVEQVIPELIFIKTRYLFYNTRKHVSYVVPRNLRDIRQLLKLLIQMPNYANDDETKTHPYNKKQFLQYLLNDWRDINLKEGHRNHIDNIIAVERFDELNYMLIKELSYYTETTLLYRAESNKIEKLTDLRNTPYNVSLGDVLSMFRLVEDSMKNEDTRKFVFLLKTLYSGEIDKPNVKIQKKEHGITHNDYEAMVSGCLFNSDFSPLIPDTMTEKYLTNRKISVSAVSELFEYCVQNWGKAREEHLIDLAEVLMLCVYYDVAKESLDGLYRRSVDLCYDNFGNSDQLRFDLGSLFFNLARIDSCFNRFTAIKFGVEFLKKLDADRQDKEKGKSILTEIIKKTALAVRPKVYKTKEERWLSYCCFRNIEIIEDFLDTVSETNYTDRKDEFKTMREFFHAAANYNIQSYDRDQAQASANLGAPYDIHFNFFQEFEKLFSEENQEVKNWFLKVYRSTNSPDNQGDNEKVSGNTSAA